MTTTDALTSGNYGGGNQFGDFTNLGSTGAVLGSSNPLESGLPLEAGTGLQTTTTTTTTQHYSTTGGIDGVPIGGTVMGVGGGVGDAAQDVTYSTKTQEYSLGAGVTGQTTTTTTTTKQYGYNASSTTGATTTGGLLMGVGGAGDSAVDVAYSTNAGGVAATGLGVDLGLGQTTKITTQYAKYFKDVKLSVLEGDANWIEVFSKNLDLSENVNIIPMDLETFTYDDSENIRFKGVNDAVKNEKFDFIIIDGPQGYIDNDNGRKLLKYSRTNVWELIPDNLADDFIIIIDDYERDGEKNTFNRIEDLLKEQGIEYYTYYSKGFNEQCALFTEKYKFISWI